MLRFHVRTTAGTERFIEAESEARVRELIPDAMSVTPIGCTSRAFKALCQNGGQP